MSCDSNRGRFFRALAPSLTSLVGSEAAGEELLDTLYDVVVSQPAPEGKAEQLAASAATSRLKARAAKDGIDLYPHPSKTGLPEPEAQAAWKAVSDVLDAVERGKPLPQLAVDAQRVTAFRRLLTEGGPWSVDLSGATLLRMRQLWAENPGRVRLLLQSPEALAGEEHAAFVREQTLLLANDPAAPPALAAAARYAQALDENDALDNADRERERWVRVLAGAAGVGLADEGKGQFFACRGCGVWVLGSSHTCDPDDIADLPEVAAAVAELLGQPEYLGGQMLSSPYAQMEQILNRWAVTRQPSVLTGAEGRLLALCQRIDRRRLTAQAESLARGYSVTPYADRDIALRNITRRSPVLFDGQPHVWDDGRLFRLDRYLTILDERRHGKDHTPAELGDVSTAAIPGPALTMLMTGVQTNEVVTTRNRQAFRFGERETVLRYDTTLVAPRDLSHESLVVGDSCGCVFRVVKPGMKSGGVLRRIATITHTPAPGGGTTRDVGDPRSCIVHQAETPINTRQRRLVKMVSVNKPTFAFPTWPDVSQPQEAANVV